MSLHNKGLSQEGETGTTDRKPSFRLYPSLPNIDSVLRYEVCVPVGSTGEKRHVAAADHPVSRLEDTQSETASGDIKLKAQILILEEQRRELLSINERWAKEYRTMKQYYREKVKQLTTLLQCDHSHFAGEMGEEGERQITLHKKVRDNESARTTETEARSELLKAEKEAKELRAQNSTLTQRWQHQREEIRRLNKALEDSLQKTQPLGASSQTLQDVWKHQAEVYKEDFLKERRDREKLKEQYLELEKKFKKVHSGLRVLTPQSTRSRPPQPVAECTCTNQAKCPDPNNQPEIKLQRCHALDNKQ